MITMVVGVVLCLKMVTGSLGNRGEEGVYGELEVFLVTRLKKKKKKE